MWRLYEIAECISSVCVRDGKIIFLRTVVENT